MTTPFKHSQQVGKRVWACLWMFEPTECQGRVQQKNRKEISRIKSEYIVKLSLYSHNQDFFLQHGRNTPSGFSQCFMIRFRTEVCVVNWGNTVVSKCRFTRQGLMGDFNKLHSGKCTTWMRRFGDRWKGFVSRTSWPLLPWPVRLRVSATVKSLQGQCVSCCLCQSKRPHLIGWSNACSISSHSCREAHGNGITTANGPIRLERTVRD